MGYSITWDFDPTHPNMREGWGRLVWDTRTIIDAASRLFPPVIVVGPTGDPTTPVELAEGRIAFNGPRWGWRASMDPNASFDPAAVAVDVAELAPDGYVPFDDGESVEPFVLSLDPSYTRRWCKTNRRRYDLVVKAVLLRGHALLGDALVPTVWSDEAWRTEWAAPVAEGRQATSAVTLVEALFGPVRIPPVHV